MTIRSTPSPDALNELALGDEEETLDGRPLRHDDLARANPWAIS